MRLKKFHLRLHCYTLWLGIRRPTGLHTHAHTHTDSLSLSLNDSTVSAIYQGGVTLNSLNSTQCLWVKKKGLYVYTKRRHNMKVKCRPPLFLFRVAKPHRMPYLYTSVSAKEASLHESKVSHISVSSTGCRRPIGCRILIRQFSAKEASLYESKVSHTLQMIPSPAL